MRLVFKPYVLEKLEEKHGVTQEEVEEAIADGQRCTFRHGVKSKTMQRYISVGKTLGGRFLRIIHDREFDETTRREYMVVVTALNAYDEDKTRYKRAKGR